MKNIEDWADVIGGNIAKYRKDRGYNLQKLGDAIGLSAQSVNHVETLSPDSSWGSRTSPRVRITAAQLARICEELCVNVEDMYER